MQITWQTEISELIDPKKVEAAFASSEKDIADFNKVRNCLEQESSGNYGWSRYACNLNGDTPLYDKARQLIADIGAESRIFYEIKQAAIAAAEGYRQEELRQLSRAVDVQIGIIQSEISQQERYKAENKDGNNSVYDSNINTFNAELKKLQTKKVQVDSLIH